MAITTTEKQVRREDIPNVLTHRPFTREMIPRLAEMTREVYGGHDYILGKVDSWIAEPTCLFLAWFLDETLVAVANTEIVEDKPVRVAEFCGLRVAPEYGGLGIASYVQGQMTDQLLRDWEPPPLTITPQETLQNHSITLVRSVNYETATYQVTAKLASRTGFTKVHEKLFCSVISEQVSRLCHTFRNRTLSVEGTELREGTYEPFLSLDQYYLWNWVVLSSTREAMKDLKHIRFLYTVDTKTGKHLAYSMSGFGFSQREGKSLQITLGDMSANDMILHIDNHQKWMEKQHGYKATISSLHVAVDSFDERAFNNFQILKSNHRGLGYVVVQEKHL